MNIDSIKRKCAEAGYNQLEFCGRGAAETIEGFYDGPEPLDSVGEQVKSVRPRIVRVLHDLRLEQRYLGHRVRVNQKLGLPVGTFDLQ